MENVKWALYNKLELLSTGGVAAVLFKFHSSVYIEGEEQKIKVSFIFSLGYHNQIRTSV